MEKYLLVAAIIIVVYGGTLFYLERITAYRKLFAVLSHIALFIAAGGMLPAFQMSGTNAYLDAKASPMDLVWLVKFLSILMLIYLLYTGLRLKKRTIAVPASVLLLSAFVFQVFGIFEKFS